VGKDKKPKTGHYLIGSAFLWAAGQWAVSWFVAEENLRRTIAAASGGLVAGWSTALILGRFAKWGLAPKGMMVLGFVFGIVFASGAVAGLDAALKWYSADKIEVDWTSLQTFILSVAVIPAAVLGIVTGLYVRSAVPPPKAKKE